MKELTPEQRRTLITDLKSKVSQEFSLIVATVCAMFLPAFIATRHAFTRADEIDLFVVVCILAAHGYLAQRRWQRMRKHLAAAKAGTWPESVFAEDAT